MSKAPSFTTFTGLDMLKIDIANAYGLDKELYTDRIEWFDDNGHSIIFDALNCPSYDQLSFTGDASDPLLFKKAVLAYQKAVQGLPVGHNVFMDATASGIQIMAALSNCKITAETCNLINNGKRNDPYTLVTDEMIRRLPDTPLFKGHTPAEIRAIVKKPIMTHFYNSTAQPKSVFGEDTIELQTFYDVLNDLFPGAEACLSIINDSWNPEALEHSWTLPDGHVCHVKVIDKVETKYQPEELSIGELHYTFYVNQPSAVRTSLAPNIIHSIDAYIVREMVRKAKEQGFELAHIHDAFTCHPNHMPKVMDNYRNILADISELNLLGSILNEIEGRDIGVNPFNYDLASDICQAEYALS